MPTLTLYELNSMVAQLLHHTLDEEYDIVAELSEVHEAYSGHCYMELVQKTVDGHDLVAKARANCWASTFRALRQRFVRVTGEQLRPGMKVLVTVRVSFHQVYGYSLTVTDIDPTYTLGDMARLRQEILERLNKEGIAHDNKNLPLPLSLSRIAVISSATAAGYGDFCHQLLHNSQHLRFHLHLFPAVMQGERTEATLLAALEEVMRQADRWDAVVIIRGGGATSDLSCFDTYLLAAACAQFPLPIITGIGHERDDTVIDAVAHTRLKTPTAVAAFLISHQADLLEHITQLHQQLAQDVQLRLRTERNRLQLLSTRMSASFGQLGLRRRHQLERLLARLQHLALQHTAQGLQRLDFCHYRLRQGALRRLDHARQQLDRLHERSQAADPKRILQRGYSITLAHGKALTSASHITAGTTLTTLLSDGQITSTVNPTPTDNHNEKAERD